MYSGKPVIINGKEYQNFQLSSAKKLDDYNFQFHEISPPGPEYYTGEPGVSFRNCPLFSTKMF